MASPGIKIHYHIKLFTGEWTSLSSNKWCDPGITPMLRAETDAEHTYVNTITHSRQNTPLSYSSSGVLMADKIRCPERQPMARRVECSSPESSLVIVQQPRHHLHSAIWMSSGSVAGCCTSLNSSSLDNSTHPSRIELHPVHTGGSSEPQHAGPDRSNTSTFATLKMSYKCAGFSYLWQKRTSWTTLNILCKFGSNN